jgi:hypothetical protein
MNIAPEDRPRVKLECVRLFTTLKLSPAKSRLIRQFIDSYLQLSEREIKQYNRQLQTIQPPEREAIMEVMNEWEAIGEKRGEKRGEERGRRLERLDLLLDDLQGRFDRIPKRVRVRLEALSFDRLKEVRQALPAFGDLSEVERWIDEHRQAHRLQSAQFRGGFPIR